MKKYLFLVSLLLFSSRVAALPVPLPDEEPITVIQAAWVYLQDGEAMQDASVILRGGRILKVGEKLEIPEGARVFSSKVEGHLTPGLIDASSTAGVINKDSWTEHADEVVCQMRNLDALDLESKDFLRLSAKGVTTVYVTPGSGSVIGCQGTVVKTGGPTRERVLSPVADVKVTLGPEGWRRGSYNRGPRGAAGFNVRRPTTRMGMGWVFRKAFYDARAYGEVRARGGASKPAPDPALETLLRVLEGKIPLRIQAREDIDIWSAIRLAREFDLKFVLEEGTEAYRCIPELKKYAVPVIFGPLFVQPKGWRSRSGERLRPCLNTAGRLVDAGIPLALTAGGLTHEEALPHQACYALRCGLSFREALSATTSMPARLLGVADRVGAIRPGLHADLVLWRGKPFSPTSRPSLVWIGGELVYVSENLMEEQ